MTIVAPADTSTLARWLETPPGVYVLGWEQDQFDSAVEDVFGFLAMQVELPRIDFLRHAPSACPAEHFHATRHMVFPQRVNFIPLISPLSH